MRDIPCLVTADAYPVHFTTDTGCTIHSDIPGTFECDMSFNPLLSEEVPAIFKDIEMILATAACQGLVRSGEERELHLVF